MKQVLMWHTLMNKLRETNCGPYSTEIRITYSTDNYIHIRTNGIITISGNIRDEIIEKTRPKWEK